MTTSQNLLLQLNNLNDTLKQLKNEMKAHLSDKNTPVSERWDIFKQLPQDCYTNESYGPSFSNMGDLVMYEGLIHAERYETINVFEMVDIIEAAKNNFDAQSALIQKDLQRLNVDVLKEEIMSKMVSSFRYDW